MNNETFGFEELNLCKKSRIFKLEISKVAGSFPLDEKFRLKDQILRSSRSINALIAEGHGRYTYPDQIHFCIQARGSLSETVNHLYDAFDENYISAEILNQMKLQAKEIALLLNGYLLHLRRKREEQK